MKKYKFDLFVHLKLMLGWLVLITATIGFLKYLGFKPSKGTFWLSKKSLSGYYDVNERTINKWIDCFLSEELRKQCMNRRRIPVDTFLEIIKEFGHPNEFPMLTRKAIVEISGSTYRSLIRTITFVGKQHGLPTDLLKTIRTFPPSYSKIIADTFVLYQSEIDEYFGE